MVERRKESEYDYDAEPGYLAEFPRIGKFSAAICQTHSKTKAKVFEIVKM